MKRQMWLVREELELLRDALVLWTTRINYEHNSTSSYVGHRAAAAYTTRRIEDLQARLANELAVLEGQS